MSAIPIIGRVTLTASMTLAGNGRIGTERSSRSKLGAAQI